MATSKIDVQFTKSILPSCLCGKPVARPGAKWCRQHQDRKGEVNAYRSKLLMPPIGVDGEGENGRYTLFAAATFDNAISTSIQNRKGLSTESCLNFLINLPRTRFVFGFAFSYDINMMLVDLSIYELTILAKTGRVYHNDWRIAHIPSKTLTITHRPTKRTVTVWDMYPWIQSSFVAMLEKFKLTDSKTLDRIARMKDMRSSFEKISMAKIKGYCLEECALLSKAVRMLLDLIIASGYHCNTFYSPGSLASAAMRKHNILKYRKEITDEALAQAINEAYIGGRSEVSQVGPIPGKHYEYDIHSAYPYAATLLPCFAHGSWQKYKTGDKISDWSLVQIRWSTKPSAIWGPFPYRPVVGSLRFPQSGIGWLWGREARIGKELCKDFEILNGYHWIPSCRHRPFAFLSEIYQKRRQLVEEKSALEYIYKLILNSIYGKLAENPHNDKWIPKWRYMPWAGLITSITRSMLLEQLIAVGPSHVVLMATDCLITNTELSVSLTDKLGDWEVHNYEDMFIAGPGFYYADDETSEQPKIRNRGIARSSVRFDDLETAWKLSGREAEVNINTRRFIGYRLALTYKDTLGTWRQFIDLPLKKTISTVPRRIWRTPNPFDGKSMAPTQGSIHKGCLDDSVRNATLRLALDNETDPVKKLILAEMLHDWSVFEAGDQPDWAIDELTHG